MIYVITKLKGLFIISFVVNFFIDTRGSYVLKTESRICDTCNKEITDNICRLFILNDLDDNPHILFYHYFLPCWSFKEFCQKYSNLGIVKAGYDVNQKICNNPKFVKQLKTDIKLWLD